MPLLITSKPIALNKSPAAPCKKLPQFIYFFTFLLFYLFTFKNYSSGSVFKLITLPVTGLRTM